MSRSHEEEMFELGVWECKDGRTMTIDEMDDNHLNNCIARIERKNNWRREWLPDLLTERERRAELAEEPEYADPEFTKVLEELMGESEYLDFSPYIHGDFVKELTEVRKNRSLPVGVDYDPVRQEYYVDIDCLPTLLGVARRLVHKSSYAEPAIEIHIVGTPQQLDRGDKEATAKAIEEIGLGRFLRAVRGELPDELKLNIRKWFE